MGYGNFVDTLASLLMAFMTFGTMVPMAIYSGKILLQTTPAPMIGQLDKCLHEASRLDGVLEFRHEHFLGFIIWNTCWIGTCSLS
ncbi:unnamed protein product, partial [Adineta steineri]